MYTFLYNEFTASDDALRVYQDNKLIFSSRKDRLLPLLEYIDGFAPHHQKVIIFDKIVGNAAALLSIKAGCREIYSPLGSQIAIRTLEKYGIEYHINEVVPYIQQANREDMCPMEKLSLDKGPEEFYKVLRDAIKQEA
jgi:hypothetical protein